MAAQRMVLSLLFLSCLFALASPAPLSPMTSVEDSDEALSKALNMVQPSRLDARPLKTPLVEDYYTSLPGDASDEESAISYVDASVFRRPANAVKPKASFLHKKDTQTVIKHLKADKVTRKESLVPSEKLEAPVDEKLFDVEVNNKVAAILSVIRKIVESENKNFAETVSTSTTAKNEEVTTTPTTAPISETPTSPESSNEDSAHPTTTAQVSPSDLTTSSRDNEDSELPRLSPPIWLHSSLAERMSDPLRLPMIEPYDRYDRYSHSIARDVLW